MQTWRIGALAAETHLTVRTLHHYDRIGLVTPSARTAGGHRLYHSQDVERLQAVMLLRRVGMSTGSQVRHASVLTGSGVVHLHLPTDDVRPPGVDGAASAIVVAVVADVDTHAEAAVAHGARLVYPPTEMSYGVREYGVCDHEGHPWSFQSPAPTEPPASAPGRRRAKGRAASD